MNSVHATAHDRLNSGVGQFDLIAAANFNDIKVNSVPTSTAIDLDPASVLFTRQHIVSIEKGTPHTKVVRSTDCMQEQFSATARSTY
jgi:iron complex outermembrane receptor protein